MEQLKKQTDVESTRWIENLALEELNMDESGMVNFNNHLDPTYLLEESSIEFMDNLRNLFENYLTKFNQYRGGEANHAHIRIFKISNTVNDFMLFRNSLRLIFARKAHDLISIGFLANGKDLFSARLRKDEDNGSDTTHDIRAHLGPFNTISWRFRGEEIEMDALVRHYLSEFLAQSAR